MSWRTDASIFSRIVGMDPYAKWLLTHALDEFVHGDAGEADPFIPLAIELRSDQAIATINATAKNQTESPLFLPIRIPILNPDIALSAHISAFAQTSFFYNLATSDEPRYALFRNADKRIRLGLPLRGRCQQKKGPKFGSGVLLSEVKDPLLRIDKVESVIVAIIDDGIAFAHERFRSAIDQTRIAYFWRQDGDFRNQKDDTDKGPALSTVPYGLEIADQDGPDGAPGINRLLHDCMEGGIVDEDKVYARFAPEDMRRGSEHKPIAQRYAHGTHVLDLAAGAPTGNGAVKRPIVAVQLPVATTADTSGTNLDVYVKHAIDYIFDRADKIDSSGAMPLIVNFSYGVTAGPHDGTSVIETGFEYALNAPGARRVSKNRKVTFVLPSGNAQMSRDHARVCWPDEQETPDPVELPWRVPPNNLTTSHLEIWLPRRDAGAAGDRIAIEIETPDGRRSARLGETHGAEVVLSASDGTAVAVGSYSLESEPTGRGLFLISMRPTEHLRPAGSKPDAPAGVWKIVFHKGPAYAGEDVEAWIQRNDTPFGYPPRARQSYFDDDGYLRFARPSGRPLDDDDGAPFSRVKRTALMNGIATSQSPVVVGGVESSRLRPADYSAGGPTFANAAGGPFRVGPDLALNSDDSYVHRGILGAGSRSGSAFTLSGTSVAAPQAAKIAAGLAQKSPGQQIGRKEMGDYAANEEHQNPDRPQPIPSREGLGRVLVNTDRKPRMDA